MKKLILFLIAVSIFCTANDICAQIQQKSNVISSGGGSSGNSQYQNFGIFALPLAGKVSNNNYSNYYSIIAESDNQITAYEYWLDDNYAGRQQMAVSGNSKVFSIETEIDVSGMNPGLHFFHIRFRDITGKWSPVQSSYFIVPRPGAWNNPANEIVQYEYWIDDNYSEKVSDAATSGSAFTIMSDIDYSYLNRGLHFFHIRFKDTEGKWSPVQSSYFVIPDVPAWSDPDNVLTEYEYWIDDRYGDKTNGAITNLSSFNITEAIDYSSLNRGLHFFHIRFKDINDKWSIVQSSYFVIPDVDPWSYPGNKIVRYEYWLDDDHDGKITVEETPAQAVTVDQAIDYAGLNQGLHFLHIRFQDEAGQWSAVQSNYFIKPAVTLSKPNSKIAGYRYWFDDDLQNTTVVTLPDPLNPYQLLTDLSVPYFDFGTTHTFYIQFVDTEGMWTSVESSEFIYNYANRPPVAVCRDVNVYLGADQSTADADINDGSYDPDDDPLTFEQDPPGPYPVGETGVTLTVTDTESQVNSCSATVTVIDNTAPELVSKNITVELDASGNAVITADRVIQSLNDNCGIASVVVSPNTFTIADIGENTVTITATDVNGNVSEATAVVTIEDATPPEVLTKTVTLTLVNGAAVLDPADVDNGSNDASGIQSMTVSPNTFSCDDIGEQEVTLTVTDNNGNTASSNVLITIEGEVPVAEIYVDPQYTVPGEAEHTIYRGLGVQSVTLMATGGTDYNWTSDPSGFTSTEQSVEVSPSDTTTYTVTVTNEYGCTDVASVTIYVVDWRCGNKMDKIMICHKGHTICIAESALQSHLDHGDYVGPCQSAKESAGDTDDGMTESSRPEELAIKLEQNSPNPFENLTEIQYFISRNEKVKLTLMDMNGRVVSELIDKYIYGGWHTLIVNGSGLTPGVYILHLEAYGKSIIKTINKM